MRETPLKKHDILPELALNYIEVLDKLRVHTGHDFTGLQPDIAQRQINSRIRTAGCKDLQTYLNKLESSETEAVLLAQTLTINVSSFFRNPLVFEYLRQRVLPELLLKKTKRGEQTLRIWSAGCATGEEPYSIAIIVRDLVNGEDNPLQINIFGTDINKESLKIARTGLYKTNSLDNVPLRYVRSCFTRQNGAFKLDPVIRDMVVFSEYDLLDEKSRVPQISVFGDFDLVFCCNVVMYYQSADQVKIFSKIARSIVTTGFLVLGEAEELPLPYRRSFIPLPGAGHFFQKR
ncbi:MAG: protein-glutamate O-methyltransferase CheR [Chlorobi bacterium]|nr:protein-glutamate O-methyltransferase CheR [Chlorobiota bacterium]